MDNSNRITEIFDDIVCIQYSLSYTKGKNIMKKTLAAVAVLGAFAGSALAADVTLYGRVNLGINYTNVDSDVVTVGESDNWSLNSGDATGSRFGIKGSEQISEDLTVGFQLEHGFNADDGTDGSDRAFHRESRLYVATNYGTLHMGRFGALDSGTGSIDVAAGFTASGTGYGDKIADQSRVMKTYSRLDNSIAYTSPEFAGMTVHAMASLGGDNGGKGEASSDVDRYYGLGVTGQWGALGAGLVVSQIDKGHVQSAANAADEDEALNVTAGVNYDFGVVKAFLAGNYYEAGKTTTTDYSQYGVSVSVKAPVASGSLEAAVGYSVGKDDMKVGEDEVKILNVGAFYKYPLSKRTYVYAGAGYDQQEEYGVDTDTIEVISGIAHHF